MIYKERVNSKLTNVYEVSFDKEKLQEIFKELEKYEYIKYFNGFLEDN